MIRFSFSFQHDTPFSLQIEVTVVLVKDQESFPSGSLREFLMPSRHWTSSSMEKITEKEVKTKSEAKIKWIFMVCVEQFCS